jgi:hypothetical protein
MLWQRWKAEQQSPQLLPLLETPGLARLWVVIRQSGG